MKRVNHLLPLLAFTIAMLLVPPVGAAAFPACDEPERGPTGVPFVTLSAPEHAYVSAWQEAEGWTVCVVIGLLDEDRFSARVLVPIAGGDPDAHPVRVRHSTGDAEAPGSPCPQQVAAYDHPFGARFYVRTSSDGASPTVICIGSKRLDGSSASYEQVIIDP